MASIGKVWDRVLFVGENGPLRTDGPYHGRRQRSGGTKGWRLTASEVEATAATLGLASGILSEEDYGNWLREHCEPAKKVKRVEMRNPRKKKKGE